MTHLHLRIERAEDLTLLVPLLNRLGISWERTKEQPTLPDAANRDHWLKIIALGGDGKSFKDASTWQKQERQDRSLPGRE